MLARLPIPLVFNLLIFIKAQILDIKKPAISWFHYFSVWPNHGAERET